MAVAAHRVAPPVRGRVVRRAETLAQPSRARQRHHQRVLLRVGQHRLQPRKRGGLHRLPPLRAVAHAAGRRQPLLVRDPVPVAGEHLAHHPRAHPERLGGAALRAVPLRVEPKLRRNLLLFYRLHSCEFYFFWVFCTV